MKTRCHCFFHIVVCHCNQTLNLLSRPEYFRLESNVENDQLQLANLFNPPNTISLARKQATVPTLTFSLTKGPVDLMSIRIGNQSGEFNVYLTLKNSSGQNQLGPIKSKQGLIEQCLMRVENVTLEFVGIPVSNNTLSFSINLTTCEHTLREFHPCTANLHFLLLFSLQLYSSVQHNARFKLFE